MFQNYSLYDLIWLGVGFVGQIFFAMRFLVQWIVSEHRRKSVIPYSFWYYSIIGGVVLLAYAVHKRDPVFMLGQTLGLAIYFRNIYFIKKQRATTLAS